MRKPITRYCVDEERWGVPCTVLVREIDRGLLPPNILGAMEATVHVRIVPDWVFNTSAQARCDWIFSTPKVFGVQFNTDRYFMNRFVSPFHIYLSVRFPFCISVLKRFTLPKAETPKRTPCCHLHMFRGGLVSVFSRFNTAGISIILSSMSTYSPWYTVYVFYTDKRFRSSFSSFQQCSNTFCAEHKQHRHS